MQFDILDWILQQEKDISGKAREMWLNSVG